MRLSHLLKTTYLPTYLFIYIVVAVDKCFVLHCLLANKFIDSFIDSFIHSFIHSLSQLVPRSVNTSIGQYLERYWPVNRWTGQYPILAYTTWRDLNQSQPHISIRGITIHYNMRHQLTWSNKRRSNQFLHKRVVPTESAFPNNYVC